MKSPDPPLFGIFTYFPNVMTDFTKFFIHHLMSVKIICIKRLLADKVAEVGYLMTLLGTRRTGDEHV